MTAEPVSLYLDLEPGRVADMEVVARTALAFAKAVRDLAYVVDPSIELRIELSSGTPGSLSLNSILRNLKNKDGEALTLKAIGSVILIWFSIHALDYTFEQVADLVTGKGHEEQRFSPEQKRELQEIVGKAVNDKVAAQHLQGVYREIERDPAIKGVGATRTPGERPAVIIPRSEFRARAGLGGGPVEQTVNRRVNVEHIRVGLISPVLLPGNRRWKLRSGQGEFGAAIKDQDFIERVLTGTTAIRMKAGIEMDVELETTEEFKNGVWEVQERNVLRVDNLIEPPSQGDLGLPAPEDHQPDDDDD
jgi:hypothetical protein